MIFYFGHCNGIKDYRVASARRPDNVLGVSSRRAEVTRTIVVMPSWYGFGWRVLDESGAAAGESSEDVGEVDYAIENARREVNRQLAERVRMVTNITPPFTAEAQRALRKHREYQKAFLLFLSAESPRSPRLYGE
jgi:hypothetical protein